MRVECRAAVVAVVAILVTTQCAAIPRDEQDDKPAGETAFEVVSVKAMGSLSPVQLADGRWTNNLVPFRYDGQMVTATQTPGLIIMEAYSLSDWELEGPSWIYSSIYEISAKMPPGASRASARLMLQKMLAERFGFKFHRETRNAPTYALVEGKHGFKLVEEAKPSSSKTRMRSGEFVSTGNLDTMAAVFANYADKPVINTTGIQGTYHIELRWEPDEAGNVSRHYDSGFWAELERVAGLRIEKRKSAHDVMIVDHLDRDPTPN
ncbi:MAG: TIGR03435 family protein [Bryobacteraceae bacterium]